MDFIFFAEKAFIFLLGLCIGSFLNAVIYRLEENKSLRGRSFCPNCKHALNWRDLIPVFSFLMLKGKCRYCKKSISFQYPAVELAAAMIFLLIFKFLILNFVNNFLIFKFLNAGFLFYIASVLIVIFVYDLKHYLIPDKILFPAIGIAFIYRLFENLEIGNFAHLGSYLLAVAVCAGFFLAIFLISGGRWMGFGDVKLAILLGLLLGIPNIFVGLFLSFFFGAVAGVILMALKKKDLKSQVPFAPFLIAGTFAALFWGKEIINWYLNVFMLV